ncbi:response regulator [Candidatus Woesearchaeota archaeon]|nr:response regulator [Candidatus Woesearchaeota archaeon]
MDLRVLLVDDESTSLHIISSLLEKGLAEKQHSVHIDMARYPEKALDLIAELKKTGQNYDFITCDYSMPGMSGREFQETVRKTQNIPFIFISAGAIGPGKEELEKPDNTYAIPKPIDAAELENAVSSVLYSLDK